MIIIFSENGHIAYVCEGNDKEQAVATFTRGAVHIGTNSCFQYDGYSFYVNAEGHTELFGDEVWRDE